MLTFFDGSLKEAFLSDHYTVIIVPITDHGLIQNSYIRDIAIEYPELMYCTNRFCEGKDTRTIIYHHDTEHNTSFAFIPCIRTDKGVNVADVEDFLSMTEKAIGSCVASGEDVPCYVIQPVVINTPVFNDTVEEMVSISSRQSVTINYICG